jgi:hypothetical protein
MKTFLLAICLISLPQTLLSYNNRDKDKSSRRSSDEKDTFPPLSEIDGNQFTDEFNVPYCNGFLDLWEDPTIPNAERNNIGRAIYQTQKKLNKARKLIKKGKIIELGYGSFKYYVSKKEEVIVNFWLT